MASPAALEYIQALRAKYPELAADLSRIAEDYRGKLWHQLTQKLETIVANPAFSRELVDFYSKFIHSFATKLNPLAFAKLAIAVSQQHAPAAGVAFMKETAAALSAKDLLTQEAWVMVTSELAGLKLRDGNDAECKALLADAKKVIDNMTDLDPVVYASFYLVAANYQKRKGSPADFYRNALLYLAYVSLDTLAPSRREQLAFDMGLAALLGEDIYSFGELLSHPILESLRRSSGAWLVDLLECFHAGDLARYGKLRVQFAAQLSAQADLAAQSQRLQEKITILGLMELVFRLPSDQRTIRFQTVAAATGLQVEEVEHLVMKALSLKLVRGSIDQVDEAVAVTWVQPRILLPAQIANMGERLQKWGDHVRSTLLFLEAETPELLPAA
jgi:26S proteasome regulatory subunit N9